MGFVQIVNWEAEMVRGYFAIGICNGKAAVNQGTLWRSAYQLGAAYVFTVGRRYKKQSSDTTKTWRHVPMFNWSTFEEMNRPMDCVLVGIEMGGESLMEFEHPERAIYLTLEAGQHCLMIGAYLEYPDRSIERERNATLIHKLR